MTNKTKEPMKPAPNLLIVKPIDKKTTTESGLHLPENVTSNTTQAYEVVKLGSKINKRQYAIGDKLIITGGIPLVIESQKLLVVNENQILVRL